MADTRAFVSEVTRVLKKCVATMGHNVVQKLLRSYPASLGKCAAKSDWRLLESRQPPPIGGERDCHETAEPGPSAKVRRIACPAMG